MNHKRRADLLGLCRNNRNLSPVQYTTNTIWALRLLSREFVLGIETESSKQKEEIIWRWICGSHGKISWLRKHNHLFMLWHWSLAEDGWSHPGSKSGVHELHYSDINATRYNWQNERTKLSFSRVIASSSVFSLSNDGGKLAGVNKEQRNSCNSLGVHCDSSEFA